MTSKRRTREHHARQAQNPQGITSDVVAKRTQRHLAELERSNYAEQSTNIGEEDEGNGTVKHGKGRARMLISERHTFVIPGSKKKKSTMNVRTALLYRKTFATLLEDSGLDRLPPTTATYLTAQAPPSRYPPRLICSVCGYWGAYKCRRCAMPYCDRNCEGVHAETRCERRVV
ncbi:HIT-type domain-containing protein [Mycena chlorophos]|uniref:HIT-type domain-containing protein n=1 Tax=Mycena chlorophos TaxID=658473 RepID=A0A8H6T041_MYCCL|nr:HIT-type domain-containing protein [Mycena chlorophos]